MSVTASAHGEKQACDARVLSTLANRAETSLPEFFVRFSFGLPAFLLAVATIKGRSSVRQTLTIPYRLCSPKHDKVRAIASARIKNDRIDSEVLAHLLRANLIPEAHAPSREIRALRRVLRQRMFFVQLRTMLRNRIRALLAQHSVHLPENEQIYSKQGRAWLNKVALPDSDAHLLRGDCELHDRIDVQIESTNALIKKLAAQDSSVTWLISLPGIGSSLSVLIHWETDDIQRFPGCQTLRELHRPSTLDLRIQFPACPWLFDQTGKQVAEMGILRGGHAGSCVRLHLAKITTGRSRVAEEQTMRAVQRLESWPKLLTQFGASNAAGRNPAVEHTPKDSGCPL